MRRRLELRHWAVEHLGKLSTENPVDWPPAARIPSLGLAPLFHGDYAVGQSGVYAALNGLRLATAGHCHLSARDEEVLLNVAWDWRRLRGEVRPDRAMRSGDWKRLVEALAYSLSRRHGQALSILPAADLTASNGDEFSKLLERLIISGYVVLAMVQGGNYTVIRGFTRSSILLFDSGCRHWLRRASNALVPWRLGLRSPLALGTTLAIRRLT